MRFRFKRPSLLQFARMQVARLLLQDLGFRVWGLGSRSLGFGVEESRDLRFRGLGFRAWGFSI